MQNFDDNNCSDYDTFVKYQRNKEKRKDELQYNELKRNVHGFTICLCVLTALLVTSICVGGFYYYKNASLHSEISSLNSEISQQTETYLEAVEYYETLNARTADNAVNDFITELTSEFLAVDPNGLTKSKLKLFIAEIEDYIGNFDGLGLSSTHPNIYNDLLTKWNDALYSLENGTYLYPYSDKDYILMCNLVQREEGMDATADECQMLVAWVALNRKNNGEYYAKDAVDPKNPTLLEVITQKNQYGTGYSYNMNLNGVTQKVQENVRKVFEGEFSAPTNVMFQTGIWYEDKVLYKHFVTGKYNSYFYYGKTVD